MYESKSVPSIVIRGNWHGNITLDVSKRDKFACEALQGFFCPMSISDLGDCYRVSVITPKQARAFVAHCE